MQNETVEQFIIHANLQLYSILASSYFSETEMSKDMAILTYILPEPMKIDDILDEIEDSMEMVVLYHVIPSYDTLNGERCCAYSDPEMDYIYKINCFTNDSGLCNTIYVTLYESLEILGADIQDELLKQVANSKEVIYSRSLCDVFCDFIR